MVYPLHVDVVAYNVSWEATVYSYKLCWMTLIVDVIMLYFVEDVSYNVF